MQIPNISGVVPNILKNAESTKFSINVPTLAALGGIPFSEQNLCLNANTNEICYKLMRHFVL